MTNIEITIENSTNKAVQMLSEGFSSLSEKVNDLSEDVIELKQDMRLVKDIIIGHSEKINKHSKIK